MVKWGILGASHIAEKFVAACNTLKKDCVINAVAAQDLNRAKVFSEKFNIESYYGSYEDMLQRADINAVYIGNVNTLHYSSCMLALKYNKHILCEKPFCMNALEAEEIFDLAKSKSLFCMEALWTRFNPVYKKTNELIKNDKIGEIKSVYVDYSMVKPYNEEHRIYNKKLGGSALLDVGVYPLNFAAMFIKSKILSIKADVELSPSGTDETSEILIKYADGKSAMLSCSLSRLSGNNGFIYGTKGYIQIPDFHKPDYCVLFCDEKEEKFQPEIKDKFAYQIEEANNCIENGLIISSIMPPEETLKIQKIMDEVLAEYKIYSINGEDCK